MVIMCGCNKKIQTPKSSANRKRNVIKRMWEQAKIEEKAITVKLINKP
jgi:hypothetical protein